MIPGLRHVDEAEVIRFRLLETAIGQENSHCRSGTERRDDALSKERVLSR